MKIFVSCGEVSGDKILANLIHQIRLRNPDAEIFGFSGPESSKLGVEPVLTQDQFGTFGVIGMNAILYHYRMLRLAHREISVRRPDLILLVDYAEFNYNLVKRLSSHGIPIYWVSPPQVWAWRSYRLKVLKKRLVGAALILPFEEAVWGEQARFKFFGHPLGFLAGQVRWVPEPETIALFPGSRPSEIKTLAPILRQAALGIRSVRKNCKFLVPCLSNVSEAQDFFYEPFFEITFDSLQALKRSSFAIIKSGTSSVEATCVGVPHIVVYRVSKFAELIARSLLRISAVSITNHLSPNCIKEFLQDECNPTSISSYVVNLSSEEIARLKSCMEQARALLLPDNNNPFERIIDHIMSLI